MLDNQFPTGDPGTAHGLWWARLKAADEVARGQRDIWDRLEDGVAGKFPVLLPNSTPLEGKDALLPNPEQVNSNLLLRASWYMKALAYDALPSVRFSREPGVDDEVATRLERLAEQIMDEGGAVYAGRDAMDYAATRGQWIVWLSVERAHATEEEVSSGAIPPAQWVEAALAGQEIQLPRGVDYQAVATAARALLETPESRLGLTDSQANALFALAEQAEQLHQRVLEGPHPVQTPAKIVYEVTPYGSWCLWDASVTEFRRIGWMARKLVFNRGEFARDERFKPEAREAILKNSAVGVILDDAQAPVATRSGMTDKVDEQDRVVLWQVWDKVNQRVHYLSPGYDGFCEVSDAYPYMDANGVPAFPDFFPCEVCTPIKYSREVPERTLGMPWLEPGWSAQVEYIKLRSAAIQAAKRSARTYIAAAGVDDSVLKEVMAAKDGVAVKAAAGYDRQRDGPLLEKVEWGQMPQDYLIMSERVRFDFANAVGVPAVAMTGEPVADTLGQEEMALKGATTTSGDLVRQFEDAWARLARKTLQLFLRFASDTEVTAYLGLGSDQPRMAGDGTPKAPLAVAVRGVDLTGCKMTARFASNTRAEEAVYIKQLQDFVALNQTVRDGAGMPYYDTRPLLERLAKAMDIPGLKPYEPTKAEMMMMMAQAVARTAPNGPPGKGDREAPGGGREDGRKAGGQRGPAGVPGRQSRNRGPQDKSNMAGAAARAKTATA